MMAMGSNNSRWPASGTIKKRPGRERLGIAVLMLAAAMAGASIVAGGGAGRALNGAAALIWAAACGILLATVLGATRIGRAPLFAACGLAGALALLIRPADILVTVAVFGVAGGVMALIAERRWTVWVALVPALYLPLHVGAAVLRALLRSLTGAEASVRTEPPPTAALVPLAMIVAALAGGWLVVRGREWIGGGGLRQRVRSS
jgi:hypothetical protein